jgi:hypothetical protein
MSVAVATGRLTRNEKQPITKHRDMASAAGAVVLEITDASSSTAGDVPSPPPVPVSDLARLDPLPSPTVAVRADRQRHARALQSPI